MSKYEPLGKYLERIGQKRITLEFTEIESILGFDLIDTLRKHPAAWYGTAEKSPTHVLKNGYEVETVSLEQEQVAFYKV